MKKVGVIVHLDSVLIRRDEMDIPLEESVPPDWAEFLIGAITSWPLMGCSMVDILIICEGEERNRNQIEDWLSRWTPIVKRIFLRPNGGGAMPLEHWYNTYNKYIAPDYSILFAVAGCSHLTALWRQLNIPTLQCLPNCMEEENEEEKQGNG